MTKAELIVLMKRKTALPEEQVRFFIDSIFDIIVKELKNHKTVKIHNFGTFRPCKYKEKRGIKLDGSRVVKEYLNF